VPIMEGSGAQYRGARCPLKGGQVPSTGVHVPIMGGAGGHYRGGDVWVVTHLHGGVAGVARRDGRQQQQRLGVRAATFFEKARAQADQEGH